MCNNYLSIKSKCNESNKKKKDICKRKDERTFGTDLLMIL